MDMVSAPASVHMACSGADKSVSNAARGLLSDATSATDRHPSRWAANGGSTSASCKGGPGTAQQVSAMHVCTRQRGTSSGIASANCMQVVNKWAGAVGQRQRDEWCLFPFFPCLRQASLTTNLRGVMYAGVHGMWCDKLPTPVVPSCAQRSLHRAFRHRDCSRETPHLAGPPPASVP